MLVGKMQEDGKDLLRGQANQNPANIDKRSPALFYNLIFYQLLDLPNVVNPHHVTKKGRILGHSLIFSRLYILLPIVDLVGGFVHLGLFLFEGGLMLFVLHVDVLDL